MDREKVMKMTDDELRIKVEELLGFAIQTKEPFHFWTDKDYPNDIAAAWPLTDRMMGRMSLLQMMMGEDGRLGICGWKFDDDGRTVWTLDAVGNDIAPRTITRAFILAMGGDDV